MPLPIAIDDLLNGKTVEWERLELKAAEAAGCSKTTNGEGRKLFAGEVAEEVTAEVVRARARAAAAYPLARPAPRRHRPPRARTSDGGAMR